MRQLSDYYLEGQLYQGKKRTVAAIEDQVDWVIDRLNGSKRQYAREVQNVNKFAERARAKVSANVADRFAGYDRSIVSELPMEFTKYSPATLELYEREKHLVGSRRFEEAEQIHKEFEAAKKRDLQKGRGLWHDRFELRRNALHERGRKMQDACETRILAKQNLVEHSRGKEVKSLDKSREYLTKKLTAAKGEYIGEDDPILRNCRSPRRLTSTVRSLDGSGFDVSTKKISQDVWAGNRTLSKGRWPIVRE
jgi:hypothetical protein